VEYRILGPLEVRANGQPIPLGGLRQRRILAALLLNPGRVVPVADLVETTWDSDPPVTAHRQVQNRVAVLRGRLARYGGLIYTAESGYRLHLGTGTLDAAEFDELVARGRAASDPAILRQALALWRGAALEGLGGRILGSAAAALDEKRVDVLEDCIELELAVAADRVSLAELQAAVATNPLRERLVGHLMLALHRNGARQEALALFERTASRLADELGIDPSPALRERYEEIVRGEPTARPTVAVVPAQLPHDIWGFTGRVASLSALDALLASGYAGSTVVISAIAGTAGVGKTALAVHWAHRVRAKFPHGQLYVNLRGFDPAGSMKDPDGVIRGFLDALQVPSSQVPSDPAAQSALYRSLLADRPMLVMLDNARDADQVRPLLPRAPGCIVLITSRNQLTDLVEEEDAHLLTLDTFSAEEGYDLLARRLGAGRVAAEPAAAEEIVVRCARLPLALSIVAAQAASADSVPLAKLADELREVRGDLGRFTEDDPRTDVRAVFSWSYRTLSAPAARLFRLIGLHPGPELSATAAASLAGVPVEQARSLLAELTAANMLTEHANGRFSCHDLLRAYAAELAHVVDTDSERRAASHRVFDQYVHTGHSAAMLLAPHRDPIVLPAPQPGVVLESLGDYDSAMAWFTQEHQVLLSAVDAMGKAGFDRHTWWLAWTLGTFLDQQGYWHDRLTVGAAALAAAENLADRQGQAHMRLGLGMTAARLGRHDEAQPHLRYALDLFDELGDVSGKAQVHHTLCYLLDDHEEELRHAWAALELYRAAGQRVMEAHMYNSIGWAHAQLGDLPQALDHCGQGLALLEELGHRRGQAHMLDSLAYIHLRLGDQSAAMAYYERALAISRELDERTTEAEVLGHLGDVYAASGDADAAQRAWQQALAVLEELEHPEAATVRDKLVRLRAG
jgi:DNA-binding SARP family transcriptional activator/tetratricopeptide (TPR) repeat protein